MTYHPIGNGLYIRTPKECHGCPCFHFEGISDGYYLDARCKMIKPTQDWYYRVEGRKDPRGGWIGENLDDIKGFKHGYYCYEHAVKEGTRAKQCPFLKENRTKRR